MAGVGGASSEAAAQSVNQLIDQVRQGSFTTATVNRLVELRAVEAVPALQQQFASITQTLPKQALASAIVRLGNTEDVYWNFLVDLARGAVESDAPFPVAFDAAGRLIRRQLSGEFVAWAEAHSLPPESASHVQVYERPVDLSFLAVTGDPRGLPLLRRALTSRNYFLQAVAAKGLAKLQDASAVPAIIDACRRAPAEAAELIARALVFFDDARARAAAETFITNPQVLDELRRLSRERGPSGVF